MVHSPETISNDAKSGTNDSGMPLDGDLSKPSRRDPLSIVHVVAQNLRMYAEELEKRLERDVIAFMGPIFFGVDDAIRRAIEARPKRRSGLAVVLESPGGVVEVVERMVDTIRHHYAEVAFFIPDRAMSAGAVFALSGDSIHMDYFSLLGPIDPQVVRGDRLIPALGYLIQYERLIEKSRNRTLTTAELMLLQKLDLADLLQFEEARELSMSLLKEWLVRYKFKDWSTTDRTKTTVTQEMKQERAHEIATALSNPQKWHSHGRGISMQVLRSEDIKLKIDDFGKDDQLAEILHDYSSVLRESREGGDAGGWCVHTLHWQTL